jgi:hypothetical protein
MLGPATMKGKNKEGGKQTTLFGLIPGSSASDKKGKKKVANANPDDDSQGGTEETQSTDITMTDATGSMEEMTTQQLSTATEESQETEPAGLESQQSYAAVEEVWIDISILVSCVWLEAQKLANCSFVIIIQEPIEWETTPPPE